MVQFRPRAREIIAKVVYYGPPLGGKTTNLRTLYAGYPAGTRGELVTVPAGGDRTIFFDFLPVEAGSLRGMKMRVQLYTVPGQVHYNATRQVVLRGVDGIVFVADSQRELLRVNREAFENLKDNLALQGLSLAEMPHVIQYNKRDLKDIVSIEDLDEMLNEFNVPFYEAVATVGVGVEETLQGVVKLVARSLRERFKMPSELAAAAAAEGAPKMAVVPPAAAEPTTAPQAGIVPLARSATAATPLPPAVVVAPQPAAGAAPPPPAPMRHQPVPDIPAPPPIFLEPPAMFPQRKHPAPVLPPAPEPALEPLPPAFTASRIPPLPPPSQKPSAAAFAFVPPPPLPEPALEPQTVQELAPMPEAFPAFGEKVFDTGPPERITGRTGKVIITPAPEPKVDESAPLVDPFADLVRELDGLSGDVFDLSPPPPPAAPAVELVLEEMAEAPSPLPKLSPEMTGALVQRVVPRVLAQVGEVRELELEVPVPAIWTGGKRLTLQFRLTLIPEEDPHVE
jgi:signal recognition particle receptor subunit beta